MVKQSPEDVNAGSATFEGERNTEAGQTGKQRSSVLLLDNEAEQARRYEDALKARGYLVEKAADGDTAVRLARETRFDVVIGNIGAEEERDGMALMSLRRARRDLPVVLLSDGLALSSARMAVECGADRYLLKPVSAERLLAVLAETIHP